MWPSAVVSSQFAGFLWLLFSIENVEAGLAQIDSFMFGRWGIAVYAPSTQLSWLFAWSIRDALNSLVSGICLADSMGILWCTLAWNNHKFMLVWDGQMVLGNFWNPRNTGKQWYPGNTFLNIIFFSAFLKMLHLNTNYFLKTHDCTITNPWNSHPWNCPSGNAKLGTKLDHI